MKWILISLCWFTPLIVHAQDFKTIYAQNYLNAQKFIRDHEDITRAFEEANLESRQCWAVVFPELVRHSALQDYIEVSLLQTLYVQFGKEYANFSVGYFQMKPSFVEHLEADGIRLFGKKTVVDLLGDDNIASGTSLHRRQIVERLQLPESEALYLILFEKIVNRLYGLNNLSPVEKVEFLSAAYNAGYWKGETYIRRKRDFKEYTTSLTLFAKGEYNYSALAVYFYTQSAGLDL